MSIAVQQLTKMYGSQKAIDTLTFSVNRGEITGFLGPNGAGKSTTMKILTGVIAPTAGTAYINGLDVVQHAVAVKRMTGYLPEHNPLYTDLYVREYLQFVGRLHGLSGRRLHEAVDDMIERCGLMREQHKKIEALSRGYRQRVGLAQALLHDPEVLILDEPTTGLDPNQILEIRELIQTISCDKTVLFSTHILQEVEALCKRVIVINRGRVVADGYLHDLKKQFRQHVHVRVTFGEPVPPDLLRALNGVEQVTDAGNHVYRLQVQAGVDIRPLVFRLAADASLSLLELREEENSMEEWFRQLTENPDEYVGTAA
jgi:ABC-2 type transport system ATP-binding protein